MDLISRVALIEIGKVLGRESLLQPGSHALKNNLSAGLIVGTRKGSLATDLEFAKTLKEGPGFASPALFSYTLPNIALAEAALHYKLTGPVFSILSEAPYQEAVHMANQWLAAPVPAADIIIAGELDHEPTGDAPKISARFTVVNRAT